MGLSPSLGFGWEAKIPPPLKRSMLKAARRKFAEVIVRDRGVSHVSGIWM
jgi:hypothetical protein